MCAASKGFSIGMESSKVPLKPKFCALGAFGHSVSEGSPPSAFPALQERHKRCSNLGANYAVLRDGWALPRAGGQGDPSNSHVWVWEPWTGWWRKVYPRHRDGT